MSMNDKGLQFNKEDTISFYYSDFCRGFKKFWWIIAIACVFCSLFNVFRYNMKYTPMYKAEVTLTVSTQERVSPISGISSYNFYYDASTAARLSSTFPHILSSNLLQEAVADDVSQCRTGQERHGASVGQGPGLRAQPEDLRGRHLLRI